MRERIGFDECVRCNEGIYFSWFKYNGLCFLPKDSYEVKLLTSIPVYSLFYKRLYKSIRIVGNYIFMVPCIARDIAVYDIAKNKMNLIKLENKPMKANQAYCFWHSIVWGKYIYFIAHYYPAIIKMNIETLELEYITDWVEQLDKNSKNDEAYFTDGVVVGDYAYLPSCCSNVVLKLELNTGKSELVSLETEIPGFNGMVYRDNVFWLVARNSDVLLRWDEVSGIVEEINFGERDKQNYIGYHCPIIYEDELYLMPILGEHIYCYKISTKVISIVEELESIIHPEPIENCLCKDTVLNAYIDNSKLYFITSKDCLWHIWDLKKKEVVSYEVVADVNMQKHIDNMPNSNQWIKYKNVDNLAIENRQYTCEKFLNYVKGL